MVAYLGPLGALIPIRAVARLRSHAARPVSYSTSLGGVRRAQVGPRAFRTWDVTTPPATRPAVLAALQGFVDGAYGPGPFVWVDDWAQVTNVLAPRRAALSTPWRDTTYGGPIFLPDGTVAGRHLIAASATKVWASTPDAIPWRVPVVPGLPVTVSLWLETQGSRLEVSFYRDEDYLGFASAANAGLGWARVAVHGVAPAGANHVRFGVSGGGRIAHPAVTWTAETTAHHLGQGADSVLLPALGIEALLAGPHADEQMAPASFQIVEVG